MISNNFHIFISRLTHGRRFEIFPVCALIVAFALFCFSGETASAANYYVAQTAQGADTGADAADAHSVAWFNTAGNWGAGAGLVSPGDTVHLCGNITTNLVVQSGGTSGNVITILFEPGATMSVPSWSGNIIDLTGKSYITIDGGATGTIGGPTGNPSLANGIIESTDNGTNLANQNNATGVYCQDATNDTVKNLVIRQLYVRVSGSDTNGGSVGVYSKWNGGSAPSNLTVTNCILSDMSAGVDIIYGPGSANDMMSYCTAYNVNWGGGAGDDNSSSTLSGLVVNNCYFHDFTNWDSPSDNCHHNGFYAYAESGGTLNGVTMFNNEVGPNFSNASPNNSTSGLFVSGAGAVGTILMYNNLFIENSTGGAPADGDIFVWPGASAITRIYNNTFIGGGGGNAIDLYGGRGSPGEQICYVENNLCLAKTFIDIYNNTTISLTANYNLGYNLIPGGQFATSANDSSIFLSFAQWQALGYDTNRTVANPNLGADYIPAADSPAIGAGVNLSSYFTTDLDGNPQPSTGNWDIGACVAADTPPSPPQIVTPADGSALTSETGTYAWSPGAGFNEYGLTVGSTAGADDIFTERMTGTSKTVTTLPEDGRPLYATLFWLASGTWESNNYTYTAKDNKAKMISPTSGSTLDSGSVTFNWSAGTGIAGISMTIGSTPGASDIYSATVTGATHRTVTLPMDGRRIYVRLSSLLNGKWKFNGYTYNAFSGTVPKAELTSPANGSTFSSGSVTFDWKLGTGVSERWLDVGSAPGASDLYSAKVTGTSITLKLPTDGRPVYVQLRSLINGVWGVNNNVFTAATIGSPQYGHITSPTNGGFLKSGTSLGTLALTWSAGTGVSEYRLVVGSSANADDLYSASEGTELSQTLQVPLDGRRIYVELGSLVDGSWQTESYYYDTTQ